MQEGQMLHHAPRHEASHHAQNQQSKRHCHGHLASTIHTGQFLFPPQPPWAKANIAVIRPN
jgi:hypothetical protein